MTNIFESPNLVQIHTQDFTFDYRFGTLRAVTPCHIPGPEHVDHVVASFVGLRQKLTAQEARKFGRELLWAADKIDDAPDCSGIAAHLEDQ